MSRTAKRSAKEFVETQRKLPRQGLYLWLTVPLFRLRLPIMAPENANNSVQCASK